MTYTLYWSRQRLRRSIKRRYAGMGMRPGEVDRESGVGGEIKRKEYIYRRDANEW